MTNSTSKHQPKRKLKHRRRKSRLRAGPSLALIAGGVLLVMSVPRFMSALVQLPGNYVSQRMERHEDVSDAALSKFASTRRGSLKWTSSGQQRVELGLAQLRQAEQNQADRKILLQHAIADLRKGLSMKPANSPAWLWLAEAEFLRGGATETVARAVEMSIYTAPLDHRHYMKRLQLSLLSWPNLNMNGRQAVANQVHYARRKFPGRLKKLAGQSDYQTLVQKILDNAPTG
jgi:hypothetical protein